METTVLQYGILALYAAAITALSALGFSIVRG
jgi:hypothetical protein